MPWWPLPCDVAGGALLANAVPHLVAGVTGRPFQTPFARPPGRGLSSSTVNVLWGSANIAAGVALLRLAGDVGAGRTAGLLACGAGAFPVALFCARHFGRLHGGDAPAPP